MTEVQTLEGNEETQTPETKTEGEKTPKETTPEPEKLPAQEEDYKKKFSESSSENQRVREENAKLLKDKEILEAKLAVKANDTPSEDELSKRYPDWEYKEDDEKDRIREKEELGRRLRKVEEQVAWETDYKSTLEKHPSLVEKEKEFKEYAYDRPEIKNLDVLAKSFLFDNPVEPSEPVEPVEKRKGLEKPTGTITEGVPTEWTYEKMDALRENDYPRYEKLLAKGMFDKVKE